MSLDDRIGRRKLLLIGAAVSESGSGGESAQACACIATYTGKKEIS